MPKSSITMIAHVIQCSEPWRGLFSRGTCHYGFGSLTQTGSLLIKGQWDCLKTSKSTPGGTLKVAWRLSLKTSTQVTGRHGVLILAMCRRQPEEAYRNSSSQSPHHNTLVCIDSLQGCSVVLPSECTWPFDQLGNRTTTEWELPTQTLVVPA